MTLPANWRTTLWGGLQAIIAGIVAGSIVFPTDWSNLKQVTIFTCVLIATAFGIKFAAVAKDKQVVGGSQQQTLEGYPVEPGEQTLVDITKESSPLHEQELHPDCKT